MAFSLFTFYGFPNLHVRVEPRFWTQSHSIELTSSTRMSQRSFTSFSHRSGFISIKGKRNLKLHVLFTRPVGVKPGITSSPLHLFLTVCTFSIVLLLCFVSATTKKRFDQNNFKSFQGVGPSQTSQVLGLAGLAWLERYICPLQPLSSGWLVAMWTPGGRAVGRTDAEVAAGAWGRHERMGGRWSSQCLGRCDWIAVWGKIQQMMLF